MTLVRPDGSLRKTLAFVDLGSPAMILSEALFKEFEINKGRPLTLNLGGMSLRVAPNAITSDSWLPFEVADSRKVDALLPAGVLLDYVVVINYGGRTLTVAEPGALKSAGIPVSCRVDKATGLVAIDVSIDGRSYPVTIDSGSAYTWLRKSSVQEWLTAHPDWQQGIGAIGPSNMRMADDGIEATGILVRIPEIKVGALQLRQVGALGIGPSTSNWDFIDWYSQKNAVPVIGWLGGNVLRDFRLTIDYPNRMTYWQRQTEPDGTELNQVGLMLIHKSGGYFVGAIGRKNGKPTVDGVQVGDKLVQIDSLRTDGATTAAVLSALHGNPGDVRRLVLLRSGNQFNVQAKVTAF